MTQTTASGPAPCAICGKPSDARYRPFCSKRCADVDLQGWLSGRYVVAGGSDEEEAAGGAPPDSDD